MSDEPEPAVKASSSSELDALARRRFGLALVLTSAMLITYFGFILLVAYAKDSLGALVTDGLSLGILLGALVIVTAWVLTGIYVRWANRVYDGALERLRAKQGTDEG